MLSRRQALFAGMGVLVGASAGARDAKHTSAATPRSTCHPLYKVIYDSRFVACASFARHVAGYGIDCHPIRGDITAVWYNDLYHHWQRAAQAIGGMTDYTALFCLEVFARDVGMRLAYRAEHRRTGAGVAHLIKCPASMQARSTCFHDDAEDWTKRAGALVSRCSAEASAMRGEQMLLTGGSIGPSSLYSWVIAPKKRLAS